MLFLDIFDLESILGFLTTEIINETTIKRLSVNWIFPPLLIVNKSRKSNDKVSSRPFSLRFRSISWLICFEALE
jgi:hypothetical protein